MSKTDLRERIEIVLAKQWTEPDDGSTWWRIYGITAATRDELVRVQDGACAVCHERHVDLVVDHCHRTGKVRGMLCGRCNTNLGRVGYDIARVEVWLRYMRESTEHCDAKARASWERAERARREAAAAERAARRRVAPPSMPARPAPIPSPPKPPPVPVLRIVPPPLSVVPTGASLDELLARLDPILLKTWPITELQRSRERLGATRVAAWWPVSDAEMRIRHATRDYDEDDRSALAGGTWDSESAGIDVTARNLAFAGLGTRELLAYLVRAFCRPFATCGILQQMAPRLRKAHETLSRATDSALPQGRVRPWHHQSAIPLPGDLPRYEADPTDKDPIAFALARCSEHLVALRTSHVLVRAGASAERTRSA